MALKMDTHISGEVLILHCSGRLVYGDETAAFRATVNPPLNACKKRRAISRQERERRIRLVGAPTGSRRSAQKGRGRHRLSNSLMKTGWNGNWTVKRLKMKAHSYSAESLRELRLPH